jgi:hypothetical protein
MFANTVGCQVEVYDRSSGGVPLSMCVCVCVCVTECDQVQKTLCTYNEYIERGQTMKERKEERKKERKKERNIHLKSF